MQIPKPFTRSRRAGFVRLCAIAAGQAIFAAGAAFAVQDVFDADLEHAAVVLEQGGDLVEEGVALVPLNAPPMRRMQRGGGALLRRLRTRCLRRRGIGARHSSASWVYWRVFP